MKLFRFLIHNNSQDETLYDDVDVVSIPDTALLIQKRPFFIPDFASRCTVQLCACIRINRLGRSIHAQFANRYYDADNMTISAHFVARDLLTQMQNEARPWDLALGFDDSVVVPEKAIHTPNNITDATLCINQQTFSTTFNKQQLAQVFDKQVARISEFYTMRQGDLLLLPLPIEEVQVHIDDFITLQLNNSDVVSFYVK